MLGITVRPAEAGDEADPHWVVPGCEDDWNRCGRRFGGARRDGAACGGQHAYSAADKVCHYRGQSFDLIESVAILNCDVLPLDITVFGKTTPEGGHKMRRVLRGCNPDEPYCGYRWLLRAQRTATPPRRREA
jgi:hypothetical protein